MRESVHVCEARRVRLSNTMGKNANSGEKKAIVSTASSAMILCSLVLFANERRKESNQKRSPAEFVVTSRLTQTRHRARLRSLVSNIETSLSTFSIDDVRVQYSTVLYFVLYQYMTVRTVFILYLHTSYLLDYQYEARFFGAKVFVSDGGEILRGAYEGALFDRT